MSRIYFLLLLLCPVALCAQQLPSASPLGIDRFLFNPAMTATERTASISVRYDQQWLGFADAPRTISAAGQFALNNQPLGIGAFLMSDEFLPFQQQTIGMTYAYHLGGFSRSLSGSKRSFTGPRKQGQFSFGISVAYQQTSFQASSLTVTHGDDQLLPTGEGPTGGLAVGAGIYYASRPGGEKERSYGYFGVSARQLLADELQPQDADADFAGLVGVSHANLTVGYHGETEDYIFMPSLWIDIAENAPATTQFSFTAEKINTYWAGLSYNINQTMALQLGYIIAQPEGGNALRVGAMGTFNLGSSVSDRGLGYAGYLAYVFGRNKL
ncbi:MAG: PorP/SprF family type IX secretion system membrane protein [Bacteroidota bacterium]